MKIKSLVVAAATVVASSAMAQSAFQGFYGQIATGYENNTIQNTNLVATAPGVTETSSGGGTATSGTAPLIIGLGYTFSLAPKFALGLGADYSTLSQTTNNATYNFAGGCAADDCVQAKYKISNRYNIFVTPSYVIDNDKLAYLKVGYSGVTVQAQPQNVSLGSVSTNLSGYVVGLGYKQIISGGFYGFGEANYYGYTKANFNASSTTDMGTASNFNLNPGVNAYNFLVGVGYKY